MVPGKTSGSGTRRPVQAETGHAGAKGRKPPGRNCTPQTRPAPSSRFVKSLSPIPETSAAERAREGKGEKEPSGSYCSKTMFTDGCGTTWVVYGSGSAQSISQ